MSKNKVKWLTKPWITKGLRTSIKNKNKLYKLYLKRKIIIYQNLNHSGIN
jgi:hypothetical protein